MSDSDEAFLHESGEFKKSLSLEIEREVTKNFVCRLLKLLILLPVLISL